jgi:hypothetical protein
MEKSIKQVARCFNGRPLPLECWLDITSKHLQYFHVLYPKAAYMKLYIFLLLVFAGQATYAQTTIDATGSLAESQIDIPISIDLKPFYAVAEKNIETVFTSPNYPNDWVLADCGTRYKYHFRRSPLQMTMSGTTLRLAFLGYYQIIGSTRVCANGTVLSPWTPACRCGFDEPERRVQIAFISNFSLMRNYILKTTIVRHEPKAFDKCEVCFWGKDITSTVINGIKQELDASKRAMEDSFGILSLRPYMQRVWNQLSETYAIPNIGYFSLQPTKLRINNMNAKNDMLNISIGLSATPVISFVKPEETVSVLPDVSKEKHTPGFNIFLEAALQYDSLSRVLNGYMAGKRFEVTEGLFKKHIVVQDVSVSGTDDGDLLIRMQFTGSFNGTALFTGKPLYKAETNSLEVKDLDYDLQTKNLFLKTAKWLFNKRIVDELKKYTSFELSSYYDTAATTINSWLNREWTKGIKGAGKVQSLKLIHVQALPQHLLLRSNCSGTLAIAVSEIELDL